MDSSLLVCPICTQPGFLNVDSLCRGLLYASTRDFICPVCNDTLRGLDKFTIHLFSHSIFRSHHSKGFLSISTRNDVADLSSKISETLDLKKPLLICDSLVNSHMSTSSRDVDTWSKMENDSPIADTLCDSKVQQSEACKIVTVPSSVNSSEICENISGIILNTKDKTCLVNGRSNYERAMREFTAERKCFPSNNPSFVQDVSTIKSPVGKGCDEFATEHGFVTVSNGDMGTDKLAISNEPEELKKGKYCSNSSEVVCDICQFSFADEAILGMHKQLIHSDLAPGSSKSVTEAENVDVNSGRHYPCLLCPKSFRMKGSLMVHVRVAHNGFAAGRLKSLRQQEQSVQDDRSYTCSVCDKLFKKEAHLTQHMKTHDGKQWACDVCSKLFTTKYFLKKHKRLHTGEMPYRCGICDKTFTFQQSYHKHLLYHSDEKPHVCSECDRAFKELSTLHNHQRIHTGEKPFACETCGKCFRQRVSYLVHRRIHTGVMPYKCTACGKSFRYKVSQRTHKCPFQPPGTVVRQSSDLVQKLRQAVDVKPQQGNTLKSDTNKKSATSEKQQGKHKEHQLTENHQDSECVILASSHIQSSLPQDILHSTSPVLWVTGQVENTLKDDTVLEQFDAPKVVSTCDSQLHKKLKSCSSLINTENYRVEYNMTNKSADSYEIVYGEREKSAGDINIKDTNKTGLIGAVDICKAVTEDKNYLSQNPEVFCISSGSSDIVNMVMSSLSHCELSKNTAVPDAKDVPVTLSIPVVLEGSAEQRQNLSADYTAEKFDLESKSAICITNPQPEVTQRIDSATLEPSKYFLPSHSFLMLNEESLNLFYETDT